jgi:hypothetical protein
VKIFVPHITGSKGGSEDSANNENSEVPKEMHFKEWLLLESYAVWLL